MTAVVVALPGPDAAARAADLELEGATVIAVLPPERLAEAPLDAADAVLVPPRRTALTAAFVRACDRAGVRIVPVGEGEPRLLARLGLPAALPEDAPAWRILAALSGDPAPSAADDAAPPRVIAVWGPHGAPGRTTVAVQLAVELARAGRRTALVDADTTAPALALLLGLGDESPGLAAACRRAELGGLDAAELARLSTPLETSAGAVEVLGGLNRPGRWPEISASRLRATLAACRTWTDETVVDVAAELDEDDGDDGAPARHAATRAALIEADAIVAVLAADPLGVSRFVRAHPELRHLAGDAPVTVVANRVRPGPLGIDARGQIRRTLDRFAGIQDVLFLPEDQRGTDAAALHARPIADVAPRSALVAAVRRLAAGLGARELTAGTRRGSSRAVRRLR
ncbi:MULTISPECIES: AAA family ATPase [Microbacterium]|uniref:AAA family ATPase n=1 Tax=Microbacterium TaxID=33882 RepID=UPI00217DD06D|nr:MULTISPECIES: P-loop NTPase [Microbacterium]UWF78222.1 P-loop NTPase [Microbacterium neungamense]WCM56394.1 P-loop NTPase [Microbacterium sp. EF45047]